MTASSTPMLTFLHTFRLVAPYGTPYDPTAP